MATIGFRLPVGTDCALCPFRFPFKCLRRVADMQIEAVGTAPNLGRMRDCVTLLEATLELMEEGIAVLDPQSNVAHWNNMAAELTGYSAVEVLGRKCPENLFQINKEHQDQVAARLLARRSARAQGIRMHAGFFSQAPVALDKLAEKKNAVRPTLVSIHHKLGHSVPGMLHKAALLDEQDANIGEALMFYPVEEAAALPHGDSGEGAEIEADGEKHACMRCGRNQKRGHGQDQHQTEDGEMKGTHCAPPVHSASGYPRLACGFRGEIPGGVWRRVLLAAYRPTLPPL